MSALRDQTEPVGILREVARSTWAKAHDDECPELHLPDSADLAEWVAEGVTEAAQTEAAELLTTMVPPDWRDAGAEAGTTITTTELLEGGAEGPPRVRVTVVPDRVDMAATWRHLLVVGLTARSMATDDMALYAHLVVDAHRLWCTAGGRHPLAPLVADWQRRLLNLHSATVTEEPEGLDEQDTSWDYPLDALLIRNENRTIYDVLRRIRQGQYVMNPEFQRDFIWPDDKQSKLIESVVMRIPLPVFYLAEDDNGKMLVVDGLQRLSTFQRFESGDLKLRLEDRPELHGKTFNDLAPKLQTRFEDCNLIFYIIDSKVPERARLDIFERVNAGAPLSRQQMRNCLFMGPATRFLKEEAKTDIFLKATGKSLNTKTMRDREFVNRFCAFRLLGLDPYRGDMDAFLAAGLRHMNKLEESGLLRLSEEFRRSLSNNYLLFGPQAFRKHDPGQRRRGHINASLWDVMATSMARYTKDKVQEKAALVREAVYWLLSNEEFQPAITFGPNGTPKVKLRFQMAEAIFKENLGAYTD